MRKRLALALVLTFAPAMAQNGLPGGPGAQIPNNTSGPPTGPAGGDLAGTYPNPTVPKTNGTAFGALATATPGAGVAAAAANALNAAGGLVGFGGSIGAARGASLSLGGSPLFGVFTTQFATAGPPATSGSVDANVMARFGVQGVALDFGVFSPGVAWMQNRLQSDLSVNLAIALNPNGGSVAIGKASAATALDVNGVVTAAGLTGAIVATKAQEQAGTSAVVAVTPSQQQSHDSAAKAWVEFTGTVPPTVLTSFNVTSVTRSSTGQYIVAFTTPFATANYACNITGEAGGGIIIGMGSAGRAAGSYNALFSNSGTALDPTIGNAVCYGRQ